MTPAHHWLPYCCYIIGCMLNGCFTSRLLYRFNQQIIPSGSQDIIFESRVPKAMKTPCNRAVSPSVNIPIIRSGPTHANVVRVIYLGKWLEENFRVVFMTQNSFLASIIQSLLVSTPANYLVSLLTYKAFTCSTEYIGLNWLIYFPIYKPCFQTLLIWNLNTRSPENTISMNCILKRLKSTFFLKRKKKKYAECFECRFLMREGDVPHEKNGEK